MKQTAVEWLISKLKNLDAIDNKDIKQAKEMEKEQIIDARDALFNGTPEQYYNETFKSE
jgi:hypothetical protein